jgi:N-acetylmuramoyl-L-alanine amidase
MKKAMIDSGHYPNHPNKGQTGYWEYQGVWKISNYLKEFLEKQGIQADLTKTYEETFNNDANLAVRGKKAQNYDLFISEHSDAMPTDKKGTVRGVKTFYDFSKPKDKVYAEELSLAVSKVMNNPNRGAETRTYIENGKTYNYYGVIRGASATNCPHIFLIENGFHDNLIDEAFLKVDDNLKKIAQAQANVILKILGIEVKEITLDDAKKTIQDKAGLDNNSMQYLEFYKYSEDLIKKLAVPMVNNIVVEESIIEPPKLIKPKVEFSKTVNNTFMLYSDVENLKVKEVNKSNGILLEENYVNSTFFWSTTDGKKYSTSILYADGITYQSNANHLPYPQDTFIINKDNSVEMKRIKSLGELNLSKVKIAIAGVGLIDKTNSSFVYDPAGCGFKGVYADVLRKTNKTMIVYNKSEDKLYLVCRPNIYHQSSLYYDLIDLAGDIGDISLALDGSGSSVMGSNGKIVFNGDGRVIHSILYF